MNSVVQYCTLHFEYCPLLLMKILGIDPGLATIGFSLLDGEKLVDYGVITTESGLFLGDRLLTIGNDLLDLITQFEPDIAAVEQLFFVQNVTNGIAVAHARGVILHALCQKGVPVLEVSPKDVKLAVCGYGNAPKDQVQRAIQQIFKLQSIPRPDDAADAIAVAYWGSKNNSKFKMENSK